MTVEAAEVAPRALADSRVVMKTWDIHNDAGTLTGFEVRNVLLTRRRACRIAGSVRGVTVTRWPRRFRWSDDEFCAFSVDGVPFVIFEPFGDNDVYWIVAEEPDPSARPLIERVREVFGAAWG
jgi:hypothetical protein